MVGRNRWIQKAIKKKGALRDWFQREYGDRAFTIRNGRKVIKKEYLLKALKRKDISEKTKRRIRLALTLRRF